MGLTGQQIDDPDEIFFTPYRQNHNQRVGAQYLFHLVDNAQEVRTNAVQLVHKNDTRYF